VLFAIVCVLALATREKTLAHKERRDLAEKFCCKVKFHNVNKREMKRKRKRHYNSLARQKPKFFPDAERVRNPTFDILRDAVVPPTVSQAQKAMALFNDQQQQQRDLAKRVKEKDKAEKMKMEQWQKNFLHKKIVPNKKGKIEKEVPIQSAIKKVFTMAKEKAKFKK